MRENYIVDYLKEEIEEEFVHDRIIDDGCSRRRPDIRYEKFTHTVIIEVDENRHSGYSCETKRMMLIFQDLGNRPIIFIRINPDGYKDENGDKIRSPFAYNEKGICYVRDEDELTMRCQKLAEKVKFWLETIPEKEVTVEQLFFS
jgi:hypothetical protein